MVLTCASSSLHGSPLRTARAVPVLLDHVLIWLPDDSCEVAGSRNEVERLREGADDRNLEELRRLGMYHGISIGGE